MHLFTQQSLNSPQPSIKRTQRRYRPIAHACVFGVMAMLSVQAQSAEVVDDSASSPTAGLQLISLKDDDLTTDSGTDDAPSANQQEDWIDSQPDETAIDDGAGGTDGSTSIPDEDALEVIDTKIPKEVAKVSLNAISPETLETFVAVVDLVRREYVEPVNDEALFSNAMSGMLTKLDSHAEFLDAEAYENLRAFTQGDVGDVGIRATYQDMIGYWVISHVVPDSPADQNSIAVGDYLHQIDSFKLDSEEQANDVEQLLTGIAGTKVDVVTSKAGRRKHSSTLQRNNSHPQNIETKLVDGIAVIKLPAFQNNSREKILQNLTRLDAPVKGILLDVRDNPGGVLTSAVQVAGLFMADTDVVQIKSRQEPLQTLSTQGNALLKPLPVVVLQNRYSASAAEVLASSLQAQKRATVMGEVSYGKGSVQSVIPIDNDHAVKLTVAHYLTAKGKKIDKIGVQPDVLLSGSEADWEQQALDLLRAKAIPTGVRFMQKVSATNNDSQ